MELSIIHTKIYQLRGQKIMLDFDLAELYEVETRILNQAVKRNLDIFPDDFMFRLSQNEWESMSSQIVMTSARFRSNAYLPLAFNEHGITMLANVLRSKKARQISVAIVKAFISLKQFFLGNAELSEKLKELESRYNKQFNDVYEAINYLLEKDKQEEGQKGRERIGFKVT